MARHHMGCPGPPVFLTPNGWARLHLFEKVCKIKAKERGKKVDSEHGKSRPHIRQVASCFFHRKNLARSHFDQKRSDLGH
ncbi:MAG TPA: hypothetical protein PK971_08775, partial [Saprospiraceae bacterium]|nr:hypothetical protein [Saprospiraceae bacterium]